LGLADPALAILEVACSFVGQVSKVADVVKAHAMSLNGLDDAAVVDAYQAALAEAGGWQVTPLVLVRVARKLTIFSIQVPPQICQSRHDRVAGERHSGRERGKAGG
jgi:hypothetical protein